MIPKIIFLIVFVFTAVILGFFGVLESAGPVIKIIYYIFLAGFFILIIMGAVKRRRPPPG